MKKIAHKAVGSIREAIAKIKPLAALTACVSIFLIPGTLVWLYNLRNLQYILTQQLVWTSKLGIVWQAYTDSFYYLHDPIVLTRAIFALVAGIEIAVIIHVRNKDGTSIYLGRNKILLFLASFFLVGAVSSLVTSFSAVTLTTDSWAVLLGVVGNMAGVVFVGYILVSQIVGFRKVRK